MHPFVGITPNPEYAYFVGNDLKSKIGEEKSLLLKSLTDLFRSTTPRDQLADIKILLNFFSKDNKSSTKLSSLWLTSFGDNVDKDNIERLIEERKEARESKNFSRADEIRSELSDMGIEIEDTPDGTIWRSK